MATITNWTFDISKEGLMMDGRCIAPFYPQLREKRIILNSSGKQLRREYDLYVKMADGTELCTHTFSTVQNIKYSEYWDECCDAELSPEAKRGLQVFLQHCIKQQKYKECYEIDKLGLWSNQPVVFAYGRNLVIMRGDREPVCAPELPKFKINTDLEEKALLEYARELVTLDPGITDVLLSISLLAVLRPIFSEISYPADFFIGLYGESGSLKSTYAKLFFGDSNEQFLYFNRSNRRQIIQCLEKYSGHTVVVDDYHPSAKKYDRERQQAILDVIARYADSGQGALAVITGEFIEGCFSLQDRMIQIQVHKKNTSGDTFSGKFHQIQGNADKLQSLLYEFSVRAYLKFDDTKDFLNKEMKRLNNSINSFRISRNINHIIATLRLFEHLFPDIKQWNIDKQLETSVGVILSEQTKHMEIVRRLEYEQDWTKEFYLMMNTPDIVRRYDKHSVVDTGEILIKGDCIYITELTLEREMRNFLGCNVKSGDIVNHLSKTQVLEEDQSQARTKKLDGRRYYVVNRSRLKLYCTKEETRAPRPILIDTVWGG